MAFATGVVNYYKAGKGNTARELVKTVVHKLTTWLYVVVYS